MRTDEFTTFAHERACEFKQMVVEDRGAKAPVPFIVVANRGSEHVAKLFPTNRDPFLTAISLAVGGMGCDLVAGTVDAYGVRGDVMREMGLATGRNPDTKQRWAEGDMERAFKAGRPWVSEGLTTYAVDKLEQKLWMINQDYKAKHHKIKFGQMWGPDEETTMRFGGVVSDGLREALARRDMLSYIDEVGRRFGFDFSGMTELEKRVHADVTVIRMCARLGIPIAYNASDPDVRGILSMSLENEAMNALMGVPGLRTANVIRGL